MLVFCFYEPVLQKEVFFVSRVCFSERVSVVQNLNRQWQMRFACRQCLQPTVPTGFFLILLILNPHLAGATLSLSSPPLTMVSQSSCFNCFDYLFLCWIVLWDSSPALFNFSLSAMDGSFINFQDLNQLTPKMTPESMFSASVSPWAMDLPASEMKTHSWDSVHFFPRWKSQRDIWLIPPAP